jgi:hypothetical protein
LKYYKDLGDKTFEQIEEADFFYQPNDQSNCIAVIVQHLHGNMLSRWTNFLTEDGKKVWRKRDDEFEVCHKTKKDIISQWEDGWTCFLNALESLQKEDLNKIIFIRKEPLTVIEAILRQMAHYPYHIGQIVYLAKIKKHNSWQSLSIPKGKSQDYNSSTGEKDPVKKF